MVDGRKLSFINDLAVTQDGKKVYFTDSSSRWQRRDYLHLIMEATADGRYSTCINTSSISSASFGRLTGPHLAEEAVTMVTPQRELQQHSRVGTRSPNGPSPSVLPAIEAPVVAMLLELVDDVKMKESSGLWLARGTLEAAQSYQGPSV